MTKTISICATKLARIIAVSESVTENTRPESAVILRNTPISDSAGGYTDVWAAVGDPVPARVIAQGMQPWEKVDRTEGRVISTSVFKIALPAGTDVRPADRLSVTFAKTGEVKLYDVIGTNGPSSFEVERIVQAVIVG